MLRVGLLQTAPTFGALDDNLARVVDLRGSVPDVDLALTPELSLTGYRFAAQGEPELLDSGDTRVRALAAMGTGVGFAQRSASGLPWNSYLLGDRVTGDLQLQHKLHPVSYPPWNEHLTFQAGSELGSGLVNGARTATAICNDMWHPVVPWLASRGGAEVLIVPVASIESGPPGTVQHIWDLILEHAAVLFQCYVVFVNRCGTDGGARFWGGSRVLGPDGSTLVRLGDEPASVAVDLDLGALRRLRADVPILAEEHSDLMTMALGCQEPSGVDV
jgi:predicted amidohydrolase